LTRKTQLMLVTFWFW